MSGRYLVELADWLRAASLTVVEYEGWQDRARSSGGFEPGRPYAVFWHHTASRTDPASDANYMCHVAPARPVANLLVARDGAVWVLAAGATNTNGKGRSMTFSRGTVPADSANTYVVGMELASSGTGENYPRVQIEAALDASIAVGKALGLADDDIATHHSYAPTRKIDPATARAVEGSWQPRSCTSSGTWLLDDLVVEHQRRWYETIVPTPPPDLEEDDEMAKQGLLITSGGGATPGAVAVADHVLRSKAFISGDDAQALNQTGQYDWITIDGTTFDRIPTTEQVDVVD